jgi:magnesium-protoporphyrin IX monomethyl ester (oxidative) cyclase
LDVVVSGEADILFPLLCKQLLKNNTLLIPDDYKKAVFSSYTPESSEIETLIVEKLDDLPIPDYHDYFIELCQTKIQESFTPVLLMESSRGCWKGEKQPCTFCGLNGNRCRYRVKNNARVLDEFKNLSKTYKVNSFIMTDTILNMNYFQNLFKRLEQQPYTLFFETTSNLTEKQLKMLSTAGVNWIQPGIESLHDELLALLNKGNSAIHNIALLKYALENGVAISWNFLYCIPGDQESYYKEMIELLPLLYHLQPPSFAQVRFDRFSVYHENPTQYNLSLKPVKAYEYVTPFKADELSSFAYYFHDDSIHDRKTKLLPVLEPLGKIINRWIVLFHNRYVDIETPQLQITEENGKILLRDTRPCARSAAYRLDTLETAIYKASRHPVKKRDLFENILQDGSFDESAINQCLDRLLNNKLVINVNDTFLALANYPPTKKVVSAFNANDMLTRPDAMKTLKKVERQLTINDWFKTLKI